MKILFFPLNLLEIPLLKKGIRSNSICEELSQFGLKVGPKKSKNEVLAEKLRKIALINELQRRLQPFEKHFSASSKGASIIIQMVKATRCEKEGWHRMP